jgi:hypothetical protein
MKVVLRIIAALQGMFGALLLLLTPLLFLAGGLPNTGRAWLAFGLLAVLGPIGLFGAVQLFRLRESGRRAALTFVVVLLLFGGAQWRTAPELTAGTIAKPVLWGAILVALVSEPARQLCGKGSR